MPKKLVSQKHIFISAFIHKVAKIAPKIIKKLIMKKTDLFNTELITRKKAAEILGVSLGTITNWLKSGLLEKDSEPATRALRLDSVLSLKEQINSGASEKLKNRANKKFTTKKRKHAELNDSDVDLFLREIYVHVGKFTIDEILLAIANRLLEKEKPEQKEKYPLWLSAYKKEIDGWLMRSNTEITRIELLAEQLKHIPSTTDLLGKTYQHISTADAQATGGVFYTPQALSRKIVEDLYSPGDYVLDPCCGSGSFLIEVLHKDLNRDQDAPLNKIVGFDIDPIATSICRLNLLSISKEKYDGTLHIYNKDAIEFLTNQNKEFEYFDLIVTNPPWGAIVNSSIKPLNRLKNTSTDSFAIFLLICLDRLRLKGKLSFLLPESFVDVAAHSSIRKEILEKTSQIKIEKLGKVFKKLLTNVIQIDILNKKPSRNEIITLVTEKITTIVKQKDLLIEKNSPFIFNISENEKKLIDKIYKYPHRYIREESQFALGIVTGNNARLISDTPFEGSEIILRGKNITNFKIFETNQYIKFDKNSFQQSAEESLYRANEKLIYRFISKNLIFAYDDKKRLSLNSANIVIPNIGLPIKYILSILQSKVIQFIFKSKFNTIKILKKHIEAMPIFLFDLKTQKKLEILVNKIFASKSDQEPFYIDDLNNIIYKALSLNKKDINTIECFIEN